jgi:Skp family chaperone for outer membrane proteins
MPPKNWFAVALLTSALFAQSLPQSAAVKPRKARSHATTASELRQLREAFASQQQEIQQQREELQQLKQQLQERDAASGRSQETLQQAESAATAAQQKTVALESSSVQQQQALAKLQTDVSAVRTNLVTSADTAKQDRLRLKAVEGVLGRFHLSGDVRLRGDSIVQSYSGCAACDPRNQERIRLRLGIEGPLSEDFSAGMYIASGALTNPISTNETLTNFFERKTVGFDRGWITFRPQAHPWLQLTGGKFAYTWLRTSMTFDPDLNPEGGSEKLSFDLNNPVVKNVSFTGMQLLFNEIPKATSLTSAAALGVSSLPRSVAINAHDGFAAGGQISTTLQWGDRITVTPAIMALNWRNVDGIAQSIAALNSPTGNALTNATINQVVVVNGKTINVPIGYRSRFLYADAILDMVVKTPLQRFPFHLITEYEQNARAATNHKRGYWIESALGEVKQKGDLQFGYSWGRIEQDAVLAAFNESELRAGSNLLQQRMLLAYQAQHNVTAQFSGWFGRTLDTNLQNAALAPGLKAGAPEPYVKRFQMDLIYKF